jgi:hypothetical protein
MHMIKRGNRVTWIRQSDKCAFPDSTRSANASCAFHPNRPKIFGEHVRTGNHTNSRGMGDGRSTSVATTHAPFRYTLGRTSALRFSSIFVRVPFDVVVVNLYVSRFPSQYIFTK